MKVRYKSIFIIFLMAAALLAIVFNLDRVMGVFPWLWNVFQSIVLGGCIAFVVNILMDWFSAKVFRGIDRPRLRAVLSMLISFLVLIVAGIVVLYIAVPQLLESFRLLAERVPVALDTAKTIIANLTQRYPSVQNALASVGTHSDNFMNGVKEVFKSVLPKTLTQTYSIASDTIHSVMNFFIGLIFSVYILLFKKSLGKQCREFCYAFLSEERANMVLYVFHLLSRNFRDFIRGRFIDALCMAGMYLVSALIFRLPNTVMITTVFGVFSLVPLFGPLVGWLVGLFLIVTVSPIKAIIFTIIFVIILLIARNLIYPKVIGTSIGLPDIWVLAAVIVGGKMLGLLGMITAVPVFGVIYTLISEAMKRRLEGKPKKIVRVTEQPDWKDFNPETFKFDKLDTDPNVDVVVPPKSSDKKESK